MAYNLYKNVNLKPAFLGLAKLGKRIYLCIQEEGTYTYATIISKDEAYHKDLKDKVISLAQSRKLKFFSASFVGFADFSKIATEFWQVLDIVPQEYKARSRASKKMAQVACQYSAKLFDRNLVAKIFLNKDGSIKEQFLTNLKAYTKVSSTANWKKLEDISEKIKKDKIKIAFINSTACGGGVALMRHALIRLYLLLGLEVSWLVLSGNSDIFTITKKKIHNVLHGIAAPDIYLNKNDKSKYNKWIANNYHHFKKTIAKLDVVIVDDPQPSGLIPLIKKNFPHIKIMYRSHTQVYSKLIDKGVAQNKNSWDFVWSSVQLADVFISHPIKKFIPANVDKEKVLYMPASTDALDGLNKKIRAKDRKYYYNLFNSILLNSGQVPLDTKRPYIIQVARFDPAKGIADVLESYRKIRKTLFKAGMTDKKMPQLLIVGNGANDDPESIPIYQEIRNAIKIDTYSKLKDDIKVARLPYNDQLLNTLLSGALIALQLSHREGFEVKVTEALMKGVPVIAYKTGGIPLQVIDGKTGYLITRGKTTEVAKKAIDLIRDKKLYKKMSKSALTNINEDYLTVNSAYRWLYLSYLLIKGDKFKTTSPIFSDIEKLNIDL